MPFGVKDPFAYKHKSREVVRAASYETCPVCGSPTKVHDGLTALVPCLIPLNDLADVPSQVILGCSACYTTQRRLAFVTVEEFKAYRSKKVTLRMTPEERAVVKKVGRPKKPINALRDNPLGELFSAADIRLLLKAADMVRDRMGHLSEEIAVELNEQKQASSAQNYSGLPTEDDDFGMTPEQEKRLADVIRYRGLIADAGLVLDEVEVLKTPFEICVLYNLIDLDKEL